MPPIVYHVLRSPGHPLDRHTRAFFESRFNQDFSAVRLHTDALAARSAHAVNALAYTVGRDITFAAGQFAPESPAGKELIAHELAHVCQQRHVEPPVRLHLSDEHEGHAERHAEAALAGGMAAAPARVPPNLSRFADSGHRVISEAGLSGAGYSREEIEAIYRGNMQRDYSQIGAVGNFFLLCKPWGFGGYAPHEHFDDFIFDATSRRWRSRGSGVPIRPDSNAPGPLDYVESELTTLANLRMSDESLVHLGNALHTIEDFFAHSNFVELINGDFSFGPSLITGSYEGDPENQVASMMHTLESVSGAAGRTYFGQQAEIATARTEPLSHSRIAKDHPGRPNYAQARRLAALVVQDLGRDVRVALQSAEADERVAQMRDIVFTKIRRYLAPPTREDPWWEQLRSSDEGAIDRRLAEAEARTPATVNQCVFSPLRNLEASRGSTWKLPIGVALPVQVGRNYIWLQAGVGISTPLPLDRSVRLPPEPAPGFVGGLQITGTF